MAAGMFPSQWEGLLDIAGIGRKHPLASSFQFRVSVLADARRLEMFFPAGNHTRLQQLHPSL